jgi:glycosyltransferase involved in cell wall biosynthesis
VIASNLGAMADAIEHGVTGLLFEAGNAADLAAQLRRLLDEPALGPSLASTPKSVASIEENASRHVALYQSLLR